MERQILQRHMRAIEKRFSEDGLSLHASQSPDEIERLWKEVGKERVHPMSEVSTEELNTGRAFWLFLKRDGRSVACISAKRVDLGGETFGDYFRNLAAQKYHGRPDVVARVSQPLDDELQGRLIYFGGIELAPDERGGVRKLGDFAQYVKMLAAERWEFDWMYTIIAYKHRRLADDYGFNGKYRNAVSWADPVPEGLANDQMFLGLNAVHFSHLLNSVEPGHL